MFSYDEEDMKRAEKTAQQNKEARKDRDKPVPLKDASKKEDD